jgi:aspartoacylase
VLVVAGTHGNESNGVHLLERWRQVPERLSCAGLAVVLSTGNPAAIAAGRRYVERDLNRAFLPALLEDPAHQELEVRRARELLAAWGPRGANSCAVALDLHSTTAAMGNSLVVYGRRPADLALAAGLQGRLGLPVYLHEKDPSERGYLVEQWPCGLVIEVGPVPQGVVNPTICRQSQLALETALALLAEARDRVLWLPERLVVHRHLRSLDRPREAHGQALAVVHPRLQDREIVGLEAVLQGLCDVRRQNELGPGCDRGIDFLERRQDQDVRVEVDAACLRAGVEEMQENEGLYRRVELHHGVARGHVLEVRDAEA